MGASCGRTAALPSAVRPLPGAGDPGLAAKRAIAETAAARVQDGDTILISSGSTTLEFARRLVDRRITVITNALDVATVLMDRPGVELVVLGGVVRRGHALDAGPHRGAGPSRAARRRALHGHRCDRAGPRPDERLRSRRSSPTGRSAGRHATASCSTDATKFQTVAPAFVFDIAQVTTLITDGSVAATDVAALRAHGVEVGASRS